MVGPGINQWPSDSWRSIQEDTSKLDNWGLYTCLDQIIVELLKITPSTTSNVNHNLSIKGQLWPTITNYNFIFIFWSYYQLYTQNTNMYVQVTDIPVKK